ncbi:hypothetical protein K2Q00_03105 [Patescibacteria group bacterium]|nr:hypothetical protein [Patescibacteria group bacterium]
MTVQNILDWFASFTVTDLLSWVTSFVGMTVVTALIVLSVLFFSRNYITRSSRRILNWISPLGVDMWVWLQRHKQVGTPKTKIKRWLKLAKLRRYRQRRYGYIKTYPEVYFLTLAVVAALYLIVGSACLWKQVAIPQTDWKFNVGLLIYTAGLAHFASGWKVVDKTHIGGVFVLGIPTIEISGLFLFVLGPDWLMKFSQIELAPVDISVPSSPEKVWRGRGPDNKPLPIPKDSDYEEPIRIIFADEEHSKLDDKDLLKKAARADDPLLRSQTQEVEYIVRMAILPGHYFDFIVKVKDYPNARVQIRGFGVAKINEEFTSISVRRASFQNQEYNLRLQQHLAREVRSWGVGINNAKIRILLSYSMNKAIEGIPEGEAQGRAEAEKAYGMKSSMKTLSEGEEIKLTNEGRGRASAVKSLQDATTDALTRRAKELELEGSDVLGAEVAREIGQSQSDKFVLGVGGIAEALGLSRALSGSIRPKTKETE